MTIEEKIDAVNVLFDALDAEIAQFQSSTSLHCKVGCGKCCFKPDIEATILEFLPFAYHLYKLETITSWHDQLNLDESDICKILNPVQQGIGLCSEYTYRGLICRLFGFSARTNKYGQKELVTCQIIKSEQHERFIEAEKMILKGEPVAVMSHYYMLLRNIDPDLATFLPINKALKAAIENVMAYFAYR